MNDRKSLVEGLTSTSGGRSLEEEFVYAGKTKATATTEIEARPQVPDVVKEGKGQTANSAVRLPLTTRVRSDFAVALKRASLQRQLNGVLPNTLQDILEDALEPWLRSNGFLN